MRNGGQYVRQAKNVDEYIAAAGKGARPKLRQVRAAIREVAPEAIEGISYGMPFYSYEGEVGFTNRLVYFGLQKSRLALYMRPQDLEEPADALAEYKSTKSALWFPLDQAIPISLIKKLVRNAVRRHEAGVRDTNARVGKRRRSQAT